MYYYYYIIIIVIINIVVVCILSYSRLVETYTPILNSVAWS